MWKIKVNRLKLFHINFTNKNYGIIQLSESMIMLFPMEIMWNTSAWLQMQGCDGISMWNRREKLGFKQRKFCWLLARNFQPLKHNKNFIFNTILKLGWTYSIQVQDYAKIMAYKQKKLLNNVLRSIVNTPQSASVMYIATLGSLIRTEINYFTDKHKADTESISVLR